MRYNLDGPHVFVSGLCAGAKGAGGWGWTQKTLLINLSVQQSPQKTHTYALCLAWFTWAPKILWRSCFLFCLAALLCLRGSSVEHEQRATPRLKQPPDAQKSGARCFSVNFKHDLDNTNEKQYGFTQGGADFIISTRIWYYSTYQLTGIWENANASLSIITALTSFIVRPDESTSRVLSYIHLRAAPGSSRQRGFLSLCLTDRWHQRALGQLWGCGISSSSSKIKEDFDGIISESPYPLPTHWHCHTTGDFHFPVIEFLSHFSVLRWSSDEVPPQHTSFLHRYTEYHPLNVFVSTYFPLQYT